MKITLEMLGAMKKPLGQGPVGVEAAEGASVERFMVDRLGYDPSHMRLLTFLIDGVPVKPSARLTAGCTLKVLMIIGGG